AQSRRCRKTQKPSQDWSDHDVITRATTQGRTGASTAERKPRRSKHSVLAGGDGRRLADNRLRQGPPGRDAIFVETSTRQSTRLRADRRRGRLAADLGSRGALIQ